MTTVKYFNSGMAGAPVLANNFGDLTGLLDACLVTGFNLKAVNTITSAAGVATVTINGGHTYRPDQVVLLGGADQAAYNGEKRVVSATANAFTFAVTGTPASPATTQTSISCKVAPLGWEKAFSGLNKAAYRSTDPQSLRHYLRVDDGLKADGGFGAYDPTWAKWANVGICESMTDIDTIVGAQAPFDLNSPNRNWRQTGVRTWGWHKWYYGRQAGYDNNGDGGAGARNWVLVGDGRFFYFMNTVQQQYQWYGRTFYCFGDFASYKPGDGYSTILKAHDNPIGDGPYWSYPMQYGCESLVITAHVWEGYGGTVVLRDSSQVGNPVRAGLTTVGVGLDNIPHAYNGRSPTLPFPNPADFALWLFPTYLKQEDSGIRGTLPGLRWLPHNRPYGDLTIIDNVVNEPGRKFLMPRYSFSSETEWGQMVFDITGPWR